MVEDEINSWYPDSDNINCFSLLHQNSRSLLGSFDKIKSMLVNLNKSFSVIGISETWLNDQTQFFAQIPGYNFVSNHRNVKLVVALVYICRIISNSKYLEIVIFHILK